MDQNVSVIIPVYNRQAFVRECIESILAQTHENFEIILIDDGSSDQTVAICREMAQRDTRIRLLERQHGGVSAARNAGLEAANGEYLFFVDSDDIIHPQLIEHLVSAMAETKASVGACRTLNVAQQHWKSAEQQFSQAATPPKTIHLQNESAIDVLFEANAFLRVMGSVMFRRDLVGTTRFRTDLFIGEDFFFIYENLIKNTALLLIDESWYRLRLHKENSSWNYSYEAFYSRFYRRKLVWECELAHGRHQNAIRQKQDALGTFLRCVSKKETTREDRKKMRAAIRHHIKELFPAWTLSQKLTGIVALYLPFCYPLLAAVKKLRKRRS